MCDDYSESKDFVYDLCSARDLRHALGFPSKHARHILLSGWFPTVPGILSLPKDSEDSNAEYCRDSFLGELRSLPGQRMCS